jgi:hypothetical protein
MKKRDIDLDKGGKSKHKLFEVMDCKLTEIEVVGKLKLGMAEN